MDILHLIDRLEELFNESRALPFTHTVMVDEDRMLDIIDQMRISIPEEIKKLAEERVGARKNKNWAESDRLREMIKEKGYLVNDEGNEYLIRKV